MGLLVAVFASLAIGGVAVAAPEGQTVVLLAYGQHQSLHGPGRPHSSRRRSPLGMKVTNLTAPTSGNAIAADRRRDRAEIRHHRRIVYVNEQAIDTRADPRQGRRHSGGPDRHPRR